MREFYKASNEQMFKLSGEPDMLLAYHLTIYYLNCERFYFPDYKHTSFNDLKPVKNQSVFKHLLKLVKDRRTEFETSSSYFLFIKAQFEIFKILEKNNPYVYPGMLHGSKAMNRFYVWNKKIEEKRMVLKANDKTLDQSSMNVGLDKSLESLKRTLGDNLDYETFVKNIKRILLQVRCRELDPIWCFCSNWVKKLPEEIRDEIYNISECDKLKDFNVEELNKLYQEKFIFENCVP